MADDTFDPLSEEITVLSQRETDIIGMALDYCLFKTGDDKSENPTKSEIITLQNKIGYCDIGLISLKAP
jgi:hypothetical protein